MSNFAPSTMFPESPIACPRLPSRAPTRKAIIRSLFPWANMPPRHASRARPITPPQQMGVRIKKWEETATRTIFRKPNLNTFAF